MTASLLAFALSVIVAVAAAVVVLGIATGVLLYIGFIPWPASD